MKQIQRIATLLMIPVLAVLAAPTRAQDAAPAADAAAATPTPAPTAAEEATINLSLNNVPIEQLVKFLSETTGKPVIKQRDINIPISVFSPKPVTRSEALELIYRALQVEGVYVVEDEEKIQLVTTMAAKGLEIRSIPEEEDVQSLDDSLSLARKVYRLKNIAVTDFTASLSRLAPDAQVTIDARTKSVVVTDQLARLKHFDLIIKMLDNISTTDRVMEVFKITHADAVQIGILIGQVLTNSSLYDPTTSGSKYSGTMTGLSNLASLASSARTRGAAYSVPIMIGELTMVPDPRTNWLIVSCPKDQLEDIRKLVEQFDVEQTVDVQIRILPVKFIDSYYLSLAVTELFKDSQAQASKDMVRIVPATFGNCLLIYSSKRNFELVQKLVEQLDTEGAVRQETRVFEVKNIDPKDLEMQITTLYTASLAGRTATGTSSMSRGGLAKFIASPRTKSMLVLAYPREFEFIQEMITALDAPTTETGLLPHLYKVKNTDANEIVKTLVSVFTGAATSVAQAMWRPAGDQATLEAVYGKIRFVVDSGTNSLVVIAGNPSTYDLIEKMIKQLDNVDAAAQEVLIYELRYSDAIEVANQINNLLSEGAVTRPAPLATPIPVAGSSAYLNPQKPKPEPVFPWQSASAQTQRSPLDRPINRMIGNVRVVPDTRGNKLLVTAQPSYFPPIKKILESLDNQQPQVFIETRMIEMTRGQDRRVGIRWTPDPSSIAPEEMENALIGLGQLGFLDSTGRPIGGPTTVASNVDFVNPRGTLSRTITSVLPSNNTILGANINTALLVQLLQKNTTSRIISEPKLTVNNNQSGNIFVGSEVPFRVNSQTTDRGSTTFGVEYRKVGISLDITPHINKQGDVDMNIGLQNSAIRQGEFIDGQIISDTREINTQMAVSSGSTMVLGGILIDNKNETHRGIPFLSSIPGLRWIFGKNDTSGSVRELMVFITPQIMRTRAEDAKLTDEATQALRDIGELEERYTKFNTVVEPAPELPPVHAGSEDAAVMNHSDLDANTLIPDEKAVNLLTMPKPAAQPTPAAETVPMEKTPAPEPEKAKPAAKAERTPMAFHTEVTVKPMPVTPTPTPGA